MDFYLDTEFIERQGTIELISIGIIDQTGNNKYYAISSEFNPDNASKWVISNVIDKLESEAVVPRKTLAEIKKEIITYLEFAAEVKYFEEDNRFAKCIAVSKTPEQILSAIEMEADNTTADIKYVPIEDNEIIFWAYFADYDWVVFCWLFGTMMDLPKGMPMYCRDLKQEMDIAQLPKQLKPSQRLIPDELKQKEWLDKQIAKQEAKPIGIRWSGNPKEEWLEKTKKSKIYNSFIVEEHNALADAQWNRLLHKSLVVYELQQNEKRAIKEHEALRDEIHYALELFQNIYNKNNKNNPIELIMKLNKNRIATDDFIARAALALEVKEAGIRTLLVSKVFGFRNEREYEAEFDWGLKLYREMLVEIIGGAVTLQLLNMQRNGAN